MKPITNHQSPNLVLRFCKLLLVLIFSVILFSCKKETTFENEQNQNEVNILNASESECATENELQYSFYGIPIAYEIDNNILRFSNWEDYDNAVKQLDKVYDHHHDERDAQFPIGTTEEEMDTMDDESGFDPFYTYKQLEQQFSGFTSKRSIIEETENSWLSNGMTGLDPDDIDFTFDDSENTLFNQNYEVKIGCSTYRMTENGLVDLANYEEGSDMETNNLNTYTTDDQNKCITNTRNKEMEFTNSAQTTRVKNKVAIYSFFVRSSAKAKAIHYRKKNNGSWRRTRTNMSVSIFGQIYNKQCNSSENIGLRNPLTGFKKRGEIRELYRWYEPLSGGKKTKKDRLASMFELSDGVTNHIVFIK